jgi:hypothetical protein
VAARLVDRGPKSHSDLAKVYISQVGLRMEQVPVKDLDRMSDNQSLGPDLQQDIRDYLALPEIAKLLDDVTDDDEDE